MIWEILLMILLISSRELVSPINELNATRKVLQERE